MDLGGRSGSTNILPGRGLINPAFVIKIVAATDDMQQQKSSSRRNPNDDFMSNLSIGDSIEAKKNGEDISGTVRRIIKNSIGDVVYVIVSDDSGKKHKVEATGISARKKFPKNSDTDRLTSSPVLFNESKIVSFGEFKNKIK